MFGLRSMAERLWWCGAVFGVLQKHLEQVLGCCRGTWSRFWGARGSPEPCLGPSEQGRSQDQV